MKLKQSGGASTLALPAVGETPLSPVSAYGVC
jgi:hypothetical protein